LVESAIAFNKWFASMKRPWVYRLHYKYNKSSFASSTSHQNAFKWQDWRQYAHMYHSNVSCFDFSIAL